MQLTNDRDKTMWWKVSGAMNGGTYMLQVSCAHRDWQSLKALVGRIADHQPVDFCPRGPKEEKLKVGRFVWSACDHCTCARACHRACDPALTAVNSV